MIPPFGSTSQMAMETFKSLAGLDILHVPFQGQAPAITSLIGCNCCNASSGSYSATVARKVSVILSGGSTDRTAMYPLAGEVSLPAAAASVPSRIAGCSAGEYH